MSKDSDANMKKYLYTQNREISWLRFNNRVLEESADETVPLIERLKFISIFSSNLDEFFMVRVGSLFDLSLVSPEEIDNKTGMTPAQQLQKIYSMIPDLIDKKDKLYRLVSEKLEKAGVESASISGRRSSRFSLLRSWTATILFPTWSINHCISRRSCATRRKTCRWG